MKPTASSEHPTAHIQITWQDVFHPVKYAKACYEWDIACLYNGSEKVIEYARKRLQLNGESKTQWLDRIRRELTLGAHLEDI